MASGRPPGDPEPLPGPLRHAIERAAAEVSLAVGEVAIVYGAADRGEMAARLRERFPEASVVVVAQDARQAAAAGERAAGASLVVAERLADVDGRVALVVLVPGGYEGKERWRAMIAEAAGRLEPGGSLVVVTHARRGAASLARIAEAAFGAVEVVARGWGGMRVLRAVREGGGRARGGGVGRGADGAAGSDGAATTGGSAERAGSGAAAGRAATPPSDSPNLADPPAGEIEANVLGRALTFATAPGVFSRHRLDLGTRLLLESVDLGQAATVLDLGCGYGAIGIAVAATRPAARVTMIDVDARAVELARTNAARNGTAVEALVADGPAALAGRRFDLVLSHFPLHAPRGDRDRLTAETHRALAPGGRFCVVVLKEYDLTPTLERVFAHVHSIAADERYIVLQAAR